MDETNQADNNKKFTDREELINILGGFLIFFGIVLVYLVITNVSDATEISMQLLFETFFVLLYIAVILTLGIGTFKLRKWARTLAIILFWISLVNGLITFFIYLYIPNCIDKINQVTLDTQKYESILPALLIFWIIIPVIFLILYNISGVKETLKHKDPVNRWTDNCPLPVIIASTYLIMFAVSMLWLYENNSVFPIFGSVLTEFLGAILITLTIIIAFILSIGLYQINKIAYWSAIILTIVGSVSYILSFNELLWELDFVSFQLGCDLPIYCPEIKWLILIYPFVFLIYLINIKKYFKEKV